MDLGQEMVNRIGGNWRFGQVISCDMTSNLTLGGKVYLISDLTHNTGAFLGTLIRWTLVCNTNLARDATFSTQQPVVVMIGHIWRQEFQSVIHSNWEIVDTTVSCSPNDWFKEQSKKQHAVCQQSEIILSISSTFKESVFSFLIAKELKESILNADYSFVHEHGRYSWSGCLWVENQLFIESRRLLWRWWVRLQQEDWQV